MKEVKMDETDDESSGSWMLCRVSRDMRSKDFQSAGRMGLVSSRSPSVLKQCIKSQKPGYLVEVMRISG